ncbi:CCKAR [Lepeophtheirus salmonis]|uniref:CCKAR n=1 Tax=Lepeophtheirus salmonis TaxID=72036 RepID=A0A7R8D4L2_LEPSM|nr:CCKAR [Lepeophtheirus salmonis]CAF3024921.1 CCKAR [Lepeophtheirus salmonis]
MNIVINNSSSNHEDLWTSTTTNSSFESCVKCIELPALATCRCMEDPTSALHTGQHVPELTLSLVTYIICIILGVFWNLFTLLVMIKGDRKSRNATNLFLISLAVADLLLVTVAAPMELVHYFAPQFGSGGSGCKIAEYSRVLSAVASILNLLSVTLERFIVIVFPMRSRSLCTMTNSRRVLGAVWGLSLILTLPVLYTKSVYDVYYANNVTIVKVTYCNDYDDSLGFAFSIYQLRALEVNKNNSVYINQHHDDGGIGNDNKRSRHFHGNHRKREDVGAQRKQVIKMLICVVVLFFLCWGPRFIMEIIIKSKTQNLFYPSIYWIRVLLFLLPFVHACVNPIIYIIMSKTFRSSIVKISKQKCSLKRMCHVSITALPQDEEEELELCTGNQFYPNSMTTVSRITGRNELSSHQPLNQTQLYTNHKPDGINFLTIYRSSLKLASGDEDKKNNPASNSYGTTVGINDVNPSFFFIQLLVINDAHQPKHLCIQEGGMLLEVHCPKDDILLQKMAIDESMWIGGNDLSQHRVWVWASNGKRMIPFVNWYTGNELKSQGTQERCLSTLGNGSTKWIPSDCNFQKSFTCEKVPEKIDPSENETDHTENNTQKPFKGEASFAGNGFIEFKRKTGSITKPHELVEVSQIISTFQEEGLFFWEGVNGDNNFALGLSLGKLVVLRNGEIYSEYKYPEMNYFSSLNDGAQHRIVVSVKGEDVVIKVDKITKSFRRKSGILSKKLEARLYLGGLVNQRAYKKVQEWSNGLFNMVKRHKSVEISDKCHAPSTENPNGGHGKGNGFNFNEGNSLILRSEALPWKRVATG